ncbi:hypothetical protein AeMF1_020173 [Aphanomyces euteiches]|nr:hypothetical protein AeMF1_020173 [Aphanomyces euteiches]KAH9189314.1 hypothetical protein AeNC1_008706 [Aphanomyces euteiches]
MSDPDLNHIQERCYDFQQAVDVIPEEAAVMKQKMTGWKEIEANSTEHWKRPENYPPERRWQNLQNLLGDTTALWGYTLHGSGQWNPDTPNAAFFLDLDASLFRRILHYLRTGELSLTDYVALSMRYCNPMKNM